MGNKVDSAAEARVSDDIMSREVFVLLSMTMISVTWRMFVPTLGLFFAGLWLDSQLGFTPWLMTSGLFVGAVISAMLVHRQIRRTSKK